MCRIDRDGRRYGKRSIAGLCVGMSVFLSACSLPKNLMTDSGSGSGGAVPREEYLLLVEDGGDTTGERKYKQLVLESTTFVEQGLSQTLSRSQKHLHVIRLQLEGQELQFGEYVADYMNYVEEGEVIATLHARVDDLAIEEAKLRLTRLGERYEEAEERARKDLEKLEDERGLIYDSYEKQIALIQYRQREQDWENERYHYEQQIADAEKKVRDLTEVGEVYEVKADMAGYVLFSTRYAAGSDMLGNEVICSIMDAGTFYAETDSQADYYPFGKEVIFETRQGAVAGRVANGGTLALYSNLDDGCAVFRVDVGQEATAMDRRNLGSLVMRADLRTVENVLVLPREAVTEENGEYFVTVCREDGSLIKTEFIPGGSNPEAYWVRRGLQEGMRIVY